MLPSYISEISINMLKAKLATLPLEPGCYLMKDKNGEVIYVGKAKKLKNRVNSYFHGTHNNKTTKLVSNIVDFDYIVAPSEKEALILEYNLIKKYKPRFNIVFMDDSSYPYLRLTLEQYPTLKLVRDAKMMAKSKAKYFGPYPNVGYARELLSLLEKIYPLRKCKTMESKVCLYYHIGLCLGPCEYKIEKSTYKKITDDITKFLNGDTKEIKDELTQKRNEYAENLLFEKAQETQTLIEAIEHVTTKEYMQSDKRKAMDVFSYYVDKGYISIVGLLYSEGKLLHKHLLVQPLYDDATELFESYLIQYYQSNPAPSLLLLPEGVDDEGLALVCKCKTLIPQRGDKKKLVLLANENAKINLDQKFEIINKENKTADSAIAQLAKLTDSQPNRIELFDNSHISGSNACAGMVVYIDGQPSKKDYRLYKVANGNNDFANMQEVLYRRLFRSVRDNTVLPDMIIVDGGRSQIKAAKEIVDSLQISSIKILGLVKNDKHQTADLMDDSFNLLPIDKESELFYLLTNMQDEVHRFAITYHKKLRSKAMTHSSLEDIEGIGPKRRGKLLRTFGSIKRIKEATLKELSDCVGEKTAEVVYSYFQSEDQSD